jgi:hypothetical protein
MANNLNHFEYKYKYIYIYIMDSLTYPIVADYSIFVNILFIVSFIINVVTSIKELKLSHILFSLEVGLPFLSKNQNLLIFIYFIIQIILILKIQNSLCQKHKII